MEDLGVSGRIILKFILKIVCMHACELYQSGLGWGMSSGFCEYSNEPFGLHKMGVPSVVGRLFLKNDCVPGVTWVGERVGLFSLFLSSFPSLPPSHHLYLLTSPFFLFSFFPSFSLSFFAVCATTCARKIVVFLLVLTAFHFKLFV